MIVGLILLIYGIGNLIGSIGGGKLSDRILARMKVENNGVGQPEVILAASESRVKD